MVLVFGKALWVLVLPELVLAPGQSYVIGTRTTRGQMDYLWNDKKVWHRSKRDVAVLYDAFGRPAAYTDNGLPE